MSDLRNFNEIFRKHVAQIILQVTKKQGSTLSLENTEKPQRMGGCQINPPVILGLKNLSGEPPPHNDEVIMANSYDKKDLVTALKNLS